MLLLFLCIFCNVLLAIIFKTFSTYSINNLNAIIVNYLSCTVIASLLIGELAIPMDIFIKAWFPYALGMSVMFIVGFNLMALSFQKAGVSLTTIIQKMSLILPAGFAMYYFSEAAGIPKIAGFIVALVAILLVNWPKKGEEKSFSIANPMIILPLAVFLLSGLIEIGLFYVEAKGLTTDENVQFTASSFLIAGIIGIVISTIQSIKTQKWPQPKDALAGIILSIPNYFTIYLLLVLLSKGWDGSVLFPVNSIGILLFTTLVGVIIYKEPLTTRMKFGLVLGVFGILLINAEAFY